MVGKLAEYGTRGDVSTVSLNSGWYAGVTYEVWCCVRENDDECGDAGGRCGELIKVN